MANTTVKKVTKKEKFVKVLEFIPVENVELVEFIQKEIDALEKKSNTKSKAEKEKAAANESLKSALLRVLGDFNEPVTVTQLMNCEEFAGLSNQKLSAMLRQMKLEGSVIRTEEKKKAYFSLSSEN